MPMSDIEQRRPLRPRALLEALGTVGVILSLVFVGLELRQNTAAVRATALNDLTTGARDLLLAVSTNAEMSDLYRKWIQGDTALTPTDRTRMRLFLAAMLRGAENAFLQTRIGVVDSIALRGYGFANNPAFQSPLFPEIWRNELRDRFHPEFAAALDSLYHLSPAR